MNEEQILQNLREVYLTGDKKELKKQYYRSIFFLSKENKIKIQKTINSMEDTMNIEDIQDIIGGTIIE